MPLCKYIVNSVHHTVSIVQFTLYIVYCTVYIVSHELYTYVVYCKTCTLNILLCTSYFNVLQHIRIRLYILLFWVRRCTTYYTLYGVLCTAYSEYAVLRGVLHAVPYRFWL